MHYIVTGAGQIGQQLVKDLVERGHEVTVVRRSPDEVPGARLVQGDVIDPAVLENAIEEDTAAIFHCIHAAYDSKVWRENLPPREETVLDFAHKHDIPVVFPESVYAFGAAARYLDTETVNSRPNPVSPLGEVRALLLEKRKSHSATAISVVAADLVGPSADPKSSIIPLLVTGPAAQGKRSFMLGNPDLKRSVTYIPDLSMCMMWAADHAEQLSNEGKPVLIAPSGEAKTQREMAHQANAQGGAKVTQIPWVFIWILGKFSPTFRELHAQRYLWDSEAVLEKNRSFKM